MNELWRNYVIADRHEVAKNEWHIPKRSLLLENAYKSTNGLLRDRGMIRTVAYKTDWEKRKTVKFPKTV